jgi:hypothetical protein
MVGYPSTIRDLPAAISAVPLLILAGAPGQTGETKKTPICKTPQDAFDAAKAAADKGNVRSLCALLSDENRDMFTAVLLIRAVAVKAGADFAAEQDKAKQKQIEAVLAKHAITAEAARNILAPLAKVSSLEYLDFSYVSIGDDGLQHFASLMNVKKLLLQNRNLTDAGLTHLKNLKSATLPFLGNNKLTDAGLVHLAGLTAVVTLDLGKTGITDAGLKHLHGMSSLRALYIRETAVTEAGAAAL